MEKRKTQRDVVKEILTEGKSITSMESFQLGITRLSAIIFDLRKQGMPIVTKQASTITRYGSATTFAVYKLLDETDLTEEEKSTTI